MILFIFAKDLVCRVDIIIEALCSLRLEMLEFSTKQRTCTAAFALFAWAAVPQVALGILQPPVFMAYSSTLLLYLEVV